MSGHAELIRDRIVARREGLAEHNPEAVDLAGVVLAAMHDAAYRHVPVIRCDRQVRHRGMQLQGEKALQIEDLAAMALENAEGAAVVLAGLRALLARMGYAVTLAESRSMSLIDAATQLIEQVTPVATALLRATSLALDPAEAEALQPRVHELKETVTAIEMAIGQRGRVTTEKP